VSTPPYHFVTVFQVRAAIDDVYGLIVEPEPWLAHWGDLVEVARVRDGGRDGERGSLQGSVRAPLGYRIGGRIDVVEVEAPRYVRMQATGTIVGAGTWRLAEVDHGTAVRFSWRVRPAARWLQLLTPVARPLFEAGHEAVVRDAVHAAAAVLDADVVRFESHAARDGRA